MILNMKWYDDAAPSGTTGDASGTGSAPAGTPPPASKETPAGGTGGEKLDPVKLKADLETATKAGKNWEAENVKLKEKLGKQGNQVGLVKEFNELINSGDKKEAALKILKHLGVDSEFTLKQPDNTNVPPEVAGKLKELEDQLAAIRQQQGTTLGFVADSEMAKRYPDWETKRAVRTEMAAMHKEGLLSTEEILHQATLFQSLIKAIPDIQKQAIEDYLEDLRQKEAGHVTGSGGGGTKAPKKGGQHFTGVLGVLRNAR